MPSNEETRVPTNKPKAARSKTTAKPNEVQLALLVDNVSEYAIFLLDVNGNVTTWNAGAERLNGYTADEIIGKHFSTFYTPKDKVRNHPQEELEIAKTVGRYEEEGWRVRKDGTQFWANVVITALRNDSGELIGFGKVTRDFSERRNAEIALRESEERFRMLVQAVQDYAIFMLDPTGNVATWNLGAQRINGYTAEEITGKHFSIFYTQEDIARRHPEEELAIAVEKGRYEEEGWRIRKNGSRFWASVVITAVFDDTGVLRGFTKVTRDLTEHMRAAETKMQQVRDQIARVFLRDILYSVTEGRLRFCDQFEQLPERLASCTTTNQFGYNSLAEVRHRVWDIAMRNGFAEDRIIDLITAVGESAMNAIVHARTPTYQICSAPDRLQVWIRDCGTGIEITSLHRATLERGYTTEGSLGHGFWLMLHTCDRVWLYSTSEGTTVVLEQARMAPEPDWLQRPREMHRSPGGMCGK
jgi:PAS domain S-box-containing protein